MKLKPIIALALTIPTTAFASVNFNGAGATFPYPFYARVFNDYSKVTDTRVNYASVGSGAGVRQFIAGTVHFAASDEPLSAKDTAKVKRGVVQFPAIGGTIAIAYNKPGCNLKLTQKQLVQLFQGKINNWKQLPNCGSGSINIVHRSDGSGTTYAFTNSLNAFDSSWKQVAKSVNWPVGIGAKGNEGVSASIRNSPGSLGYVNSNFVKSAKLQVASLQNKDGKFVMPTVSSGASALNNIKLDNNLAGENPNPSGANSYPISTLTWILAYRTGNGSNTQELKKVFGYMLSSKAQMIADDLGYIPLSGSILNRSRLAVNRIAD